MPDPGSRYSDELCPRASSSDLTDYDVPGFNEEDNFGDDELTDGKSSSSGRLSSDREDCDPTISSILSSFPPPLPPPHPIPSSGRQSLTEPSDLGTLQSGPSQPKLKQYGCISNNLGYITA